MGKLVVVKFGRYKGWRITDVPKDWLEWWFYSKDYKAIPKFVIDEVFRRRMDVSHLIAGDPEFVRNPRF
jgi:hypothetical protein